ncbi:MAG: hypothetical protein ACKPFK_02990, partial [Dolichospermum sp.]
MTAITNTHPISALPVRNHQELLNEMKKMTPQALAGLSDRTKLVYAGRDPSDQFGFVNTPIYRGSTVIAPTMKELLDRSGRYIYGTMGTPT